MTCLRIRYCLLMQLNSSKILNRNPARSLCLFCNFLIILVLFTVFWLVALRMSMGCIAKKNRSDRSRIVSRLVTTRSLNSHFSAQLLTWSPTVRICERSKRRFPRPLRSVGCGHRGTVVLLFVSLSRFVE